jgi:hypothetical protein
MDAADEAHGSRRERRLIVAEKRAGAGQSYSDVIGILHLPKISGCRCRSILGPEYTQDESRAIHDRDDHIDIHGIHGGLHDILDVCNLQGWYGRNWRRSDQCAASASAADDQRHERERDSQSQAQTKRQRLISVLQRAPGFHGSSQ